MIPIARLDFQPSRRLAGCLLALHGAALAAAVASIAFWPVVLVTAGIFLSGFVTAFSALRRLPGGVCSLELHADDSLRWLDQDGHWHTAVFAPQAYVSAWLVVVGLDEGPGGAPGTRWMVLAPDSADADSLRQLRIRLLARVSRASPPNNHVAK